MTAEANRAIVARFFETYAGDHDVEAAGDVFAEGATITDSNMPGAMDIRGYQGLGMAFLAAFTGLHAEIIEQIVEGDRVVTRVAWGGTHTGDFNGIPATGKSFRAEAIMIDRLAGGKIAERHTVSDYMTMMQQLGVIPAPGQVSPVG